MANSGLQQMVNMGLPNESRIRIQMSLKIRWILRFAKNWRNPTTFGFVLHHIPTLNLQKPSQVGIRFREKISCSLFPPQLQFSHQFHNCLHVLHITASSLFKMHCYPASWCPNDPGWWLVQTFCLSKCPSWYMWSFFIHNAVTWRHSNNIIVD